MIKVDIPGVRSYALEHAVFDVNGTLAVDGTLVAGVDMLLARLSQQIKIHMLTADTHGQQTLIDQQLGLQATIITRGALEKASIVKALGGENVIAIGNGANDAAMFAAAGLAVAILGEEGLAVATLQAADVVVSRPKDAIRLLLHPDRLRATLRR